jgi:hypothetical protein
MTKTGKWIETTAMCMHLEVSITTLLKWRQLADFPQDACRRVKGRVQYEVSKVDAWRKMHDARPRFRPTTAKTAAATTEGADHVE